MLSEESRIVLPDAPADIVGRSVRAWTSAISIDTYEAGSPDRYPAYLDQRVYQGSSGAVYPLPFIESVAQVKTPRLWDAVHLENEYVRLMILPELGGRIHVGLDKTRGYDFFYRNDVIKPALVGLAGPWISGGVEFNWPQHHRPATYLPCEVAIEEEPDGSVTVWCSDHDPFARMQGMHGLRLRPGSALIEVRAHVVNRTDDVQTFLWWANVAAAVNDDYQSFFPTDVRVVADHAKRAITTFPAATDHYYGVDYPAQRTPERPDGDRLDWYRNIPVPTSYMCLGTQDDFFGGYDHGAHAGFVHWADHRVAPGKKQWTWGNAPFGWAWDAQLTDTNGPYVELMAGVFTDNQPDFAFLKPGETKTFSQYWYPIQDVGPVHQATRDVAVRLDVVGQGSTTRVRAGVATTSRRPGSRVLVRSGSLVLLDERVDLAPGAPFVQEVTVGTAVLPESCELVVEHDGDVLVTWSPRPPAVDQAASTDAATEPPEPSQIDSVDELYVTGVHLAQYRHATRSPEPYWSEALRRDLGDARSHVALGARRQHVGSLEEAERHLRAAATRLTRRNPNPRDGEAHYRLGIVLGRQGRTDDARSALATAMWDGAWLDAATVASARLDLADGRTAQAADDLAALLVRSPGHHQARNLAAVAARRQGDLAGARAHVEKTLATNPLDAWARDLASRLGLDRSTTPDPTVALDVAKEYLSIGEDDDAADLLEHSSSVPVTPGRTNVGPLALVHLADLELRRGRPSAAEETLARAQRLDRTWCFPSAGDNDALERLRRWLPGNEMLAELQGHWLYAARRRTEAIEAWEVVARSADAGPVVLRNLGIAAHNVQGDPLLAADYYARARSLAPDDARLLFESDQLAGRLGVDPAQRIDVLLERPDLVGSRDDLSVQLAELLTARGRAPEALDVLTGRVFQPWEGGEGRVLAAWEEAHLSLARQALADGDPAAAVEHARAALDPVPTLGEARHALANTADLHLVLGDALAAAGEPDVARAQWESAAEQHADFQGMQVHLYSERTAAAVTALRRLGRSHEAQRLRDGLGAYVTEQAAVVARVDYFATSLPTMLLFTQDVQAAHDTRVRVLEAQLALLDDRDDVATAIADEVLAHDPLNPYALALASPTALRD
ncbi:DUF5107 domain-containing protein [Cellulomonas humilata]|uniref:DUF5107 domain-containing protein n=1 Tax=Cellulomonas humilata TaxID=144055 RepID=A0A7Y6A4V8_9CELL|nr:DUF5107 domain-containing protein [Cellulomonas humilata]NUU18707.1 DUF5107 domain-containing protein [Cellulomonas humilata]